MAAHIFYWVLNAGILGSAIGLIVLLLRRVRGLPRFGVYLLWALPFLRLWMPIGIANRYSLLHLLSRYVTKTVEVPAFPVGGIDLTTTNTVQAAATYFPMQYKSDVLESVFRVAGTIWAIVAIALIVCAVILHVLTKAEIKEAEHIRDNLYRSDKILSPAVYGILRPKILLPTATAGDGLDYILQHEAIHIRRRDNLWRVVAVITACVHWFNPLVWVFVKCFFADMELACDSGVLKRLNADGKKAYAAVLLASSVGETYYASAFGGAKTRVRIEHILSYKRLTLASGMCFAVLFAAVAVALLTNAAGG